MTGRLDNVQLAQRQAQMIGGLRAGWLICTMVVSADIAADFRCRGDDCLLDRPAPRLQSLPSMLPPTLVVIEGTAATPPVDEPLSPTGAAGRDSEPSRGKIEPASAIGRVLDVPASFQRQVAGRQRAAWLADARGIRPSVAKGGSTARELNDPPVAESPEQDAQPSADRSACRDVEVWLNDRYPDCKPGIDRLDVIQFNAAQASLTARAQRQLETVAATLRQHGSMRVVLHAHAGDVAGDVAGAAPDAAPGGKRRRTLATSRADAVAVHLSRLGVSPARLVSVPPEPSLMKTRNSAKPHAMTSGFVEIIVLVDAEMSG